jgi:DNA mismatch endonuclease (patch repair protein)
MANRRYSTRLINPKPTSIAVRNSMRANRAKDTAPELILRKELWRMGLRGYRLHTESLPGRPDLVFARAKLAIFVNGCFWHRCPRCSPPIPKSNREFWITKFRRNRFRDRRKINNVKKLGWRVISAWECEITQRPLAVANLVRDALKNPKGHHMRF